MPVQGCGTTALTVTGGGRAGAPLALMTARIIGVGLALRTKGPVAFPHATPRGPLRLPCVAEFGPEVNPRTPAEMREHRAGWSVCSTRARLITAGVTVASAGVAAEDGQPDWTPPILPPDVWTPGRSSAPRWCWSRNARTDPLWWPRSPVAWGGHSPSASSTAPSLRATQLRSPGHRPTGWPLVGAAAALRGALPPPSPRDDDDPYLRARQRLRSTWSS